MGLYTCPFCTTKWDDNGNPTGPTCSKCKSRWVGKTTADAPQVNPDLLNPELLKPQTSEDILRPTEYLTPEEEKQFKLLFGKFAQYVHNNKLKKGEWTHPKIENLQYYFLQAMAADAHHICKFERSALSEEVTSRMKLGIALADIILQVMNIASYNVIALEEDLILKYKYDAK